MSGAMDLREREGAKYGGSAEGIRSHYDIGNDYWRLVLDSSLTYSCALYATPQDDLETAQKRKIEWHLAGAGVERAKAVLEVGCGWGSVLRRLSDNPSIERSVGLTLSDAQADYLASISLPRAEVRIENWATHQPTGLYDSIISIGAFEHFAKWDELPEEKRAVYRDYFERCHRWLSPTGCMSLQTIAFGNMKREDASEFMNREVFPESDLPFLSEIIAAVDGLFEITALRNDRLDYARTWESWAANLRRHRRQAVTLVGEEMVRRHERFFRLSAMGFRMGKLHLLRCAMRPITDTWTITGSESWGPARLRLV
jgi:cyclopropane-fatty-acyl-phospholipid synthase